jgi:hypothetical protein
VPRLPRAPRVTLEITESLIDDAIPRDSSHCLWAEAVKSAVPDATRVAVDIQTIRFTDAKKGLRFTYLTPRTAQIALVQFDQGIKPEPHSVVLRSGQVTPASKKLSRRTLSIPEIKQRKAAHEKAMRTLKKAQLRQGSTNQHVPDKVGGKTPPVAAGKRRAFGLRGMEY